MVASRMGGLTCGGARQPRILIVEQEEILRTLLRVFLESQGYAVSSAANGQEALRLSQEHNGKIDVLLLDVDWEETEGDEIIPLLHKLTPHLIFLSGYTNRATRDKLSKYAPYRLLEKPFHLDALSRLLRAAADS